MDSSLTRRIPWLRVLVEGVVIVASILLAFGIDAWWDRYQQRGEEQELLAGLESDFVSTLAQLDRVINRHQLFAERAARLESMSDAEVRAIPADSAEAYVRAVSQYMTFEAQGGTLGGLVSAGQLGLLQDSELRGLLTAWLQRLDDSAEEAGFLTSTALQIAIRTGRVASLRNGLSGDDLLSLLRDEETLALMRAKVFFGGLYAGELRGLRSRGDSILTAVRAGREES